MNYPDSVQFLYSLGNEIKTAKLGLERIRAVLEALGNPHERGRFVHVAGTNGKGSVCAMIESGLRAAGIHTGLFTSPHLVEPVERIRIDGGAVTTEEFAAAFDRVHQAAEKLIEHGSDRSSSHLFRNRDGDGIRPVRAIASAAATITASAIEVGLGRTSRCDQCGHA